MQVFSFRGSVVRIHAVAIAHMAEMRPFNARTVGSQFFYQSERVKPLRSILYLRNHSPAYKDDRTVFKWALRIITD